MGATACLRFPSFVPILSRFFPKKCRYLHQAIGTTVPTQSRGRDCKSIGFRASGFEGEPTRVVSNGKAQAKRPLTVAPNGLVIVQLHVLLNTIAAGQRTSEGLVGQLDSSGIEWSPRPRS